MKNSRTNNKYETLQPSRVLLVKLLISDWLHYYFRLGRLIDKFNAKNNNMRLYTMFLALCCVYDYDYIDILWMYVIMIVTQQRKNRWFCTVLFTTEEILVVTIQQNNNNFTLLCYQCQFLMVCCREHTYIRCTIYLNSLGHVYSMAIFFSLSLVTKNILIIF